MKPKSVRSYLLAGLVVWLPVIVTLLVLRFIIDLLDKSMALLPHAYQPEQLFGFHMPGFGVIFSLLLLFLTGLFATNFLGQRLVRWSEAILDRIPLVRSIYSASKQVMETVFSSNSEAFRKVLLIEYPRKGLWTIAFQTGVASQEVCEYTGEDMLSVFVPTTPNPTSGFLMMVAKSSTTELSMSIDDALKLIISLGVMQARKPV
ncbi:MAG: DUF502 domain-containing protein [Legionellaceae bacterium]|nr:DUF502 domain-containing protein [Legionellaceae bacterium]